MMLQTVVQEIPEAKVYGDEDIIISGISMDSRNVSKGDLFVCLKGDKFDGVDFVSDVIERGAAAVVVDDPDFRSSVPTAYVPKIREHLGSLSSRVYGEPSRSLAVLGLTGTNGKTTTACILESILNVSDGNAGYMGTLGWRWNGHLQKDRHTTPEAVHVQKALASMKADGIRYVVMECSSHGIELGRVNAVHFDVAAFTNLTPEHLDFHRDMRRYEASKKKLFVDLLQRSEKSRRAAVLNIDDPIGKKWASEFSAPVVTFAVEDESADIFPKNVSYEPEGIRCDVALPKGTVSIESKLVGSYNLSNILCAMSCADVLGIDLQQISRGISQLESVPGRLQSVSNEAGLQIYVDYAHTVDALENLISALRPTIKRRTLIVFGCGGDRDKSKRPKMGEAASKLCDVVFITTDNPRSEDAEKIASEVAVGIPNSVTCLAQDQVHRESKNAYAIILDREQAIRTAIETAAPGDTVLIIGKGPDAYQEVQGVRTPFYDDQIAAKYVGGGEI